MIVRSVDVVRVGVCHDVVYIRERREGGRGGCGFRSGISAVIRTFVLCAVTGVWRLMYLIKKGEDRGKEMSL